MCTRLKLKGLTQTVNGYDQPALLVAELADLFPGRPIILMRAGLQPTRQLIDKLTVLMEQMDQPIALTLLSNADVSVNPFAGLQASPGGLQCDPGELVKLLAPGRLHSLGVFVDHFVLLSADLVSRLTTENSDGGLMQRLLAAGATLMVPDHLFLHDPQSKVFASVKLQPHESGYPPPFSELSSRLQQWFSAGITNLPIDLENEKPATLHITHSWGGGVSQWLKSFIETDHEQRNYQLRSEHPQSGLGYGQKISLYAGNELRCPVASWWLVPPVESITDSNTGYQEILSEICERYDIGRVFVSSLVGHSLDALRSGRPTLQILHDHFPVWPLLSVNPKPYLRDGGAPDLKLALQDHTRTQEFPDKNLQAWSEIRDAYVHALKEHKVKIAAPGQSVLDLQKQLEPAFTTLDAKVIPHGFPAIEGLQAVSPKARKDGRLRLLVLGRMQSGKGQQLLFRALPELAKHVQVYLLGAGKSGEAFFGVTGVDVILEYQRDELPAILAEIGPDFAALLSVVPETFSFTLSELQQMHIPVIATRVGSFPHRIKHGKTGWLVDAEPQDLVRQVADLCKSPDQIAAVRANLPGLVANTLDDMLKAFNKLCPLTERDHSFIPAKADLTRNQQAAAEYQHSMAIVQLKQAFNQQAELKKEVGERTEWALETGKQLKHEQKRREEWVERLSSEIARLQHLVMDQQRHLEDKEAQLAQLSSDYQQVHTQNTLILGSTSWKITRPLRVGRRAAKNFMLARAWNPARWPWLLSQLIRNLSTLGIEGTIQRLQYTGPEAVPEPHPQIKMESVGDVQAPAAFPKTDQPQVSIVIPVYNKWVYTAACLRSLLDAAGKYSFEVIVVDDQSTDETAERLADIDGLTHLRNEKNLGFVGSCNRGARQARGEYLVLLNNDTQVLEGWLDELIDTFEREPQAGLVGARLVYPDGSLQESGGIVFNDGSGWNYGRGKQAENPEFLYLRETDYCSGACIALKTKYFHQIGGFDERYAPAYYEDTDLAFRVRESGLKVLIQPLSAVIHHEGITSGT
ncbi:MAG: glycosyltransferase, partial [Lysobacterales bacterium]